MRKKGFLMFLNFVLIGIMMMVCGCVADLAMSATKIGIGDRPVFPGLASKDTKRALYKAEFKVGIDTKEIIEKELGKPEFIINMGNQDEVLFYKKGGMAWAFAIKNGYYQDKEGFTAESVKKPESELRAGLMKFFPCFQPYTPRPGDTAETVLAQLGKPDDSIPLYYEDDKVVSEMLIYYESPKKFLAVGIARGKVVRTQEFALKEGQGLKDALASAGITPAVAPEPTPAPRPTTRTFGPIPTTGFMP